MKEELLVAANAQPTGQFGKYAEEIVREYNKVGTGDERKDWAARDKINKILRMLSSFKLKAWVMGDGTVAIADTKPRGAKQDVNDLIAPLYNAEAKVCNSTNPVVVKAMNACAKNAIPKGYERVRTGFGVLKKGMLVGYGDEAYEVVDDTDPDSIVIKKVGSGQVRRVRDLDLDYPIRKA